MFMNFKINTQKIVFGAAKIQYFTEKTKKSFKKKGYFDNNFVISVFFCNFASQVFSKFYVQHRTTKTISIKSRRPEEVSLTLIKN
jgi:sucrose-6-phosphate hydrolase SacC (GH32 family)